jgi:MerR family transcriptional regulator/heat shock protein HspR
VELAVVTLPWEEPGRGLFSISVAAELAGLHPQTLRSYEQEGLLSPARSSGGTRRYSADDLDRLQQIIALTADGLNLAGVRRVLELQEETRRLQAEVERLSALVVGGQAALGNRETQSAAGSQEGRGVVSARNGSGAAASLEGPGRAGASRSARPRQGAAGSQEGPGRAGVPGSARARRAASSARAGRTAVTVSAARRPAARRRPTPDQRDGT